MNSSAENIRTYDELFAEGKYADAAHLAATLLWQLYRDDQEEDFQRILLNTAQTTETAPSVLWLTIGDILFQRNDYDKARSAYFQGFNSSSDDETEVKAKLSYGIGNTHFMEADLLRAKECYEQSLHLCEGQGLTACEAENLTQLSDTARALGDFQGAEAWGKQSFQINLREKRAQGLLRATQSLCNLARYLDGSGNRDGAQQILSFCYAALTIHMDDRPLRLVDAAASELKLQTHPA
jgi:hypothetical protein